MTDPNTTPPNKSDQAPKTPEQIIAERDRIFSIVPFSKDEITESFPVQRGKDRTVEEGWMLVGKGMSPDGLYEVGKFAILETYVVNGEKEQREVVKHLRMDEQIALRDRIEQEKAEQTEERLVTPLAQEMGEDIVRKLVDEPIPPAEQPSIADIMSGADGVRARLRAAVDQTPAEKPAEKEPLLSEEERQLLGAFINQAHNMSESFADPSMSKEESDAQKNRFVGGVVADMTEKLRAGTLSAEAYAFITGTLLGMAGGNMLTAIAEEMINSGKFTHEDMNHIYGQFASMQAIDTMPVQQADNERASYLFNLEQVASGVYSANGLKPNNAYLALTGMVAGLSMQFKTNEYRQSSIPKAYGALEYVRSLKA